MTTQTLKIHSENILPIIKKWLYSEKDIFLRELVSNACDALQKLKVLNEQKVVEVSDAEQRIDVIVDKDEKTIKIIDTGLGMTKEEVEKYIAQIAFSGAEDFVEKYKSEKEGDQIIGHFGLGFYSAYMVADTVEINTLSYKENETAALWTCDGNTEYNLEDGTRDTRGTEITLHVGDEHIEYLDLNKIKELLNNYCAFLPFPIFLNEEQINKKEPLWLKPASECTDQEYLEFYRQLHPMEEDPLFWVHLNVDYPFNLKGILYFPKLKRDFDFQKNTIKLFCNRVFVSDNCKDLIPEYLMVLKGAIDSPDIPLNVSRSTLQMDSTVRQLAKHVSKKVSDRLETIYKTDKDQFIKAWEDINIIIKLGAIQDEKFYNRVKNFLLWKNLDGEWTTIEDYIERHQDKLKGRVIYTNDAQHSSEFLDLYKSQGVEVLLATTPVDAHLISFLETKLQDVKIQRVDGSLDDILLDKEKENTLLDADGKTESGKLASLVEKKLNIEKLKVEAKSLASDTLPAFIVFDEQARRFRDYMMSVNPEMANNTSQLMEGATFVVNTNSKLIKSIDSLDKKDPNLSKELIDHLYNLSLLSQKEMPMNQLSAFVSKSTKLLESLAEKAVNKE